MRIAFILLISIHAIIHLLGFLKAFGIYDFAGLSQPISVLAGIAWLLAFLLFAATLSLFLWGYPFWWALGILALVVSQVLIFSYWSDAKYGTLLNLVITVAVVIGYSRHRFQSQINQERKALLGESVREKETPIKIEDIEQLPLAVQNWLSRSGIIGTAKVSKVYLTQELALKLKPEQADWYEGTAEQFFTAHPPAFNWSIHTQMNAFLKVAGRDKFQEGKGEMLIKLLSLIPVADVKNHPKINQAALQRYLAEIVWFPSAALSPYIEWEELDSLSAKATLEYGGTKGSGIFHFDKNGHFRKFVALRYRDTEDDTPTEWVVVATKLEERQGIIIPTECEASWSLPSGQWTWLKLRVTHIAYDFDPSPMNP